jgi:hypothetical protein
VLLGGQAVTAAGTTVAPAISPFTGDGPDSGPDSMAKLLLSETGQDFVVGGNLTIVGTAGGGEIITVVSGTVVLDASFNTGADTVVLPGSSDAYAATLSGSFVTIAGGDISVAIPVGIAGLAVQFDDGVQALRFDAGSGQVMLGDQPVPAATSAGIEPPAEKPHEDSMPEPSFDDLFSPADSAFAVIGPLESRVLAGNFDVVRLEFRDSFTLG